MQGKKAQYKTDTYAPVFLVTKDNIASLGGAAAAKTLGYFDYPANYADLYGALWKGEKAAKKKSRGLVRSGPVVLRVRNHRALAAHRGREVVFEAQSEVVARATCSGR